MNRTHKLLDMGDYFTPIDFEFLEKYNNVDIFTMLALTCIPIVMLFVTGWLLLLFQVRRNVGSWTLAWKVCMRRIAQLSETSSPP